MDMTKKKAIDIMKNKDKNERKYLDKLKEETEIQKQLEEQRFKNQQLKETLKFELRQKQLEIQIKNRQFAEKRKQEKQDNLQKYKEDLQVIEMENRLKRDFVKHEELKIRVSLDQFRISRETMSKGQHTIKVDDEA